MLTTVIASVSHLALVTKESGPQTAAQETSPHGVPKGWPGLAGSTSVRRGPASLRIYMVRTVLDYLTEELSGRATFTLPGSVRGCHWDINKEVRGFLRHTVL